MATKIRLQRQGRKGYPFYKIIVADSRAPRDGKFIERIGSYNPNTNPATIDLNFDRALYWLSVGAKPSDTVRNILSREGALYMNHLNGGVRKGAFDQETANRRFEEWIKSKREGLLKVAENEKAKSLEMLRKQQEQEEAQHQERAKALEEKRAALAKEAEEAAAAAAAEESASLEAGVEAPQEEQPQAEAPAAE